MKRWRVFLTVILPVTATSIFIAGFYAGSRDSLYFKINKSLEIFGSLFREVSEKYVDDLDPEEFVKTGINKMLDDLDPYTTFYDDGGQDDIDALTTGSYTGFGISVGTRDSLLTIVAVYDGYSAQQNGVRIGDRILNIDTAFVLRTSSDALRKYTRGEPGSTARLRFLRGINDTITTTLTRQVIRVTNVSYAGILPGEVGYIKLERFSRRAAEEVRSALGELKVGRQLNGVVLDLRDNPGGLLESAVDICEIFVPTGSRIVSTRGRDISAEKVYTSNISPSEPNLPLAVLINANSASASEVVAGAIQDLDRGVIVGERSFGKGLVQNVFPLAHSTSVKITTARYYTPSGRCIQSVDFAKRRAGVKEQSDSGRIFYTQTGRVVRELHGIQPDTTVRPAAQSEFIRKLTEGAYIYRFANEFSAPLAEFSDEAANRLYKDFGKWLVQNGGLQTTPMESIAAARKAAAAEQYPRAVMAKFDVLEKLLRKEQQTLLKQNEGQLRPLLENEVVGRLATHKDAVAFELESDSSALAAARIAVSPKYRQLLSTTEENTSH